MSATPQYGDAVERVHEALRERIVAGAYEPGSRLVLSRLAQEHGVSLIPIREALRRLEAERLVFFEPNRGATVTPVSVADLRDIYATREVLEPHALATAMAAKEAGSLDRAESELETMGAAIASGREAEASAADRRFHLALYSAADSTWTMFAIEQLWTGAERYLRRVPGLLPPEEFLTERRRLLEAVRAGDREAACALLVAGLRAEAGILAAEFGRDESEEG